MDKKQMKSKQSIRILIGLMSVALVGVMLIQFLWIRSAIHLKQEQFDRSVNMAMIRVSADLENKYGVHFITEQLERDSVVKKEVMKKAPGFYRFMISVEDDGQSAGVSEELDTAQPTAYDVPNNACSPTQVKTYNNSSIITMTTDGEEITTINVIGKEDENDGNRISLEAAVPDAPDAPDAWPEAQVKTNLIKIVNNVADAYEMSKINAKDVSDVIDSQRIRSAIQKEFLKQGLPQDFVFATYCVQGDTLMINKGQTKNPLKEYTYKSPLLATDFIEAGSLLLINFPSHLQYIFSSVAGMLILSLCFTLTILSAFIYSLMVIYKQKKLSDITSDFINNMTHELKTPLATISMTADTLGLASVNNNVDRVNEYSGMIKNEVRKLSRHVDRILEAAVMETNTKADERETVDLNQLVDGEAKIFEPIVQSKDGMLETMVPQEQMKVTANRDMLRGAICNLLDNAVKYSTEMPKIKIALTKTGDKAILSVTDNGIGISRTDQKMVFEKFFRASTGNLHDVKGFGLGLSYVKTVVENTGGRVWVESDLGKGSKFFIELPLIP